MSHKRNRSPALAILLLVATLALAVRSLWVSDFLRWQSIDDSDHRSLVQTTWGLRTARLGLAFVYDQAIVSMRNPREVDAALASPGLSYVVEDLPEHPSLARRLGFGFERITDERPESFRNSLELSVPLWLVAMLLAIGPARWLLANRAARAAGADKDPARDAARNGLRAERRPLVKTAVIALAVGIVMGAAAALFYAGRRHAAAPATAPTGTATVATADHQPPIHPIVGMWRIRMDSIRATYQFANDGSFVVTFTGLPQRPTAPSDAHDAGGTWRVDDKELILTYAWSNTPLVVVGERETATFVAIDPNRLELEHADRKGRPERLVFERTYPFEKGKADVRAIIGRWKSPQFTLDLKPGGEVAITYDGRDAKARAGKWSQQGKTLTLLMEAPYVKSAAQRAAHPHLTEPREETYDIRTVDELRLILHRRNLPETEHIVFARITPA
ncbi:MAG TPA: hypothetical protein VGR35_18015 [Tepidisphaeraceae bacterium]|nr:hypothetical protein [Tepidisphaeraceae bacterium]